MIIAPAFGLANGCGFSNKMLLEFMMKKAKMRLYNHLFKINVTKFV